MKLSFSLPSKSSKHKPSQSFTNESSATTRDQPNHEYVTEFDATKTLTEPSKKNENLIIPPKANEWRPYKKMKNLDLPPIQSADGKALEFEIESSDITPSKADPGSHMSYGLNLRENSAKEAVYSINDHGKVNSVDAILLKKLKTDLDRLPEYEGFEQFEEVPVEGFVASLLAGYGWHEGRGIGRNSKEDVKVVEYKRHSAKEGIGFCADYGSKEKGGDDKTTKKDKESEKEGKNGKSSRFGVGMEVRIIGGIEMGLKGSIVEVLPGGDSVILRLLRNEEEIRVLMDDVAELGSVEEEKCLRKLKELKIHGSKDDDDDDVARRRRDKKSKSSSSDRKESRRGRDVDRRGNVREVVKNEKLYKEERRTSRVSWLRSHIRVRIISKEFKGGRFYLKKGEVVDVAGPTTCHLSMDDGREIVQGVDQDILETALPRRGGPVLVLLGKHKGAYGSLVEKDTERETGVVQDADTHKLLNVRLEQIAEYVGDPSYIGY